jgi:hypothetical protein
MHTAQCSAVSTCNTSQDDEPPWLAGQGGEAEASASTFKHVPQADAVALQKVSDKHVMHMPNQQL